MSESDPEVVAPYGAHGKEINWLVDRFVDETPGVAHAVVITEDGLLMAVSDRLRRDRAEQIAAVSAGLASLVIGAAKAIAGGAVRQTIVEMEYGVMLLMAVADGSLLAVLAADDADLGLVGYEASMLVRRVGAVITPGPRSSAKGDPGEPVHGPVPVPPRPPEPAPTGAGSPGAPSRPSGTGPFGPGPGPVTVPVSAAPASPGPASSGPTAAPASPATGPATAPHSPAPTSSASAPTSGPGSDPEYAEPTSPAGSGPTGSGPVPPGAPTPSVRPSGSRSGRGSKRRPPSEDADTTQSSVRPVERAPRQRPGRHPKR